MSTDSQQRMSIYLLIVLRMFIHSLILLRSKKKNKKKTKPKFELGGFLWKARVIGLWLVFA